MPRLARFLESPPVNITTLAGVDRVFARHPFVLGQVVGWPRAGIESWTGVVVAFARRAADGADPAI